MVDLFSDQTVLDLPERVQLLRRVDGNSVKMLYSPKATCEVHYSPRKVGGGCQCSHRGRFRFGAVSNNTTSTRGDDAILKVDDASSIDTIRNGSAKCRWVLPKLAKFDNLPASDIALVDQTLASWDGAFNLRRSLTIIRKVTVRRHRLR